MPEKRKKKQNPGPIYNQSLVFKAEIRAQVYVAAEPQARVPSGVLTTRTGRVAPLLFQNPHRLIIRINQVRLLGRGCPRDPTSDRLDLISRIPPFQPIIGRIRRGLPMFPDQQRRHRAARSNAPGPRVKGVRLNLLRRNPTRGIIKHPGQAMLSRVTLENQDIPITRVNPAKKPYNPNRSLPRITAVPRKRANIRRKRKNWYCKLLNTSPWEIPSR
ncbi:hypothetical protein SDC9_180298 [bioreactor metagenome]|uniref:Uncharacterized protein n=1 Tax=bioreactor metagenome TaxID=1076179 RepID=A0A645H1E1_9ZZZZ